MYVENGMAINVLINTFNINIINTFNIINTLTLTTLLTLQINASFSPNLVKSVW